VLAGRRLVGAEPFDALFSSHPRASTHVVAASLARGCGLPWLADYRDRRFANDVRPYPTAAHAEAMRRLEARVLRRADAVSAINRPILDDLVARHPWLAGRGHVLPNGYDTAEVAEPVDLGPGFWIVYTGRLYRREQVVESFLTALAALPDDVKALFVGGAPRVVAVAERLGIAHRVRVEPLVPHARALGYQRAAGALLLVTHERPESMSSKVFEYLHAGRPVFAITGSGTAAAGVLRTVGGAVMVGHDADMRAAASHPSQTPPRWRGTMWPA
jgi:glycosyltransferase involved in cell wall biosynthesis